MIGSIKNGQTSVIRRVKLIDLTTSKGMTGLLFSSSGLYISTIADNEATSTQYTQAGSTIETITTLGTFAAPTATKCRFKEVDATKHPGVYEIQLADARFAVASAKELLISIGGVTNLQEMDLVVPLVADDPYVAKPANSALLVIDGSGRVDVGKVTGTAQTARDLGANIDATVSSRLAAAGYTAPDNATIAAIAGYVDTEVGAIKAKTDQLVFTKAGELDANVQSINDVTITGLGTLGNEFKP